MTDFIGTAAARLRNAYGGTPVAPLRDVLGELDSDAAYAIQAANTEFWVQSGRRLVGRKVGLTAKVVQAQLGVDQPDFGALFEDMRIASGGYLNPAKAIQPKVEAEIAFVLGADLVNPELTLEDASAAVAAVHAAIEIVDSRIADWKISFADTVADNGSSAFFVLSDAGKAPNVDVYTAGMVLEVNGDIASHGVGAAALGNPLRALAWLARTSAQKGNPLRAGEIVLAGALGPMVALAPGDHVRALVGGIGEASFTYARA